MPMQKPYKCCNGGEKLRPFEPCRKRGTPPSCTPHVYVLAQGARWKIVDFFPKVCSTYLVIFTHLDLFLRELFFFKWNRLWRLKASFAIKGLNPGRSSTYQPTSVVSNYNYTYSYTLLHVNLVTYLTQWPHLSMASIEPLIEPQGYKKKSSGRPQTPTNSAATSALRKKKNCLSAYTTPQRQGYFHAIPWPMPPYHVRKNDVIIYHVTTWRLYTWTNTLGHVSWCLCAILL